MANVNDPGMGAPNMRKNTAGGVPMLVPPVAGGAPNIRPTSGSSTSLNSLISYLFGQVRNPSANPDRGSTIDQQQQTQADYGKDDAFNDAQALMDKAIGDVMAERMPGLTMSAEGAGASASSMRALLMGNIMNEAATEASALGARQAVEYGNINNQAGAVLEQLTRTDPAALNALVDAMRLRTETKLRTEVAKPKRQRQVFNNNRGGGVGAAPARGTGTGGLAQAVFLPSNPQPSTDSFFNRPGGIADKPSDSVSYGPAANYDPSAVLSRLQAGLTPLQQLEGVPGAANLYDTSMKF